MPSTTRARSRLQRDGVEGGDGGGAGAMVAGNVSETEQEAGQAAMIDTVPWVSAHGLLSLVGTMPRTCA